MEVFRLLLPAGLAFNALASRSNMLPQLTRLSPIHYSRFDGAVCSASFSGEWVGASDGS